MATLFELDDIDIIKEKSGISDEQLDREIEENILWKLAGLLGNYELYVRVPGFHLNSATIADLKACAEKNGHQHAMREALIQWRNVTHTFTYRSLIKILINLDKRTVAKAVCETVSVVIRTIPHKKGPSEIEPSDMKPSKRLPGQMRSDGGIGVKINEFEERFITLQKATLKELTAVNCKISVSEFRQALMILPSSIKNENKNFVMSNYSVFEKAESIEHIFLYLNFYLSYIDFSLLEHIIEQFGSKALKKEMIWYAQDMREFRKRTTISQALRYLPKHDDLPLDISRLTVKINFDVEVSTLEDLDEYRRSFASRFLLSHLAFFLSTIENGSLLVTWLVPIVVGAFIRDEINKKDISFFLKNNILKLSFDGEQLYPAPTKITPSQSFVAPLSKPCELSSELPTEVIQSSANELTVPSVDTVIDPDPRRETADKISTLIESTPDCRGLAIMIPREKNIELDTMSEFLSNTFRFAVYNPPVDPTSRESLSVRSTMESVHLVELKHRPIMVVTSGLDIYHCYLVTDHGSISIKDDIVEPLFSPATPHLADNPKILLFITYDCSNYSSLVAIFPSNGGNYIVGIISCNDVDSVTSTILRALDSRRESVQEIFEIFELEINQLRYGRMIVIDHLKEPVYLHPDAPQRTHSVPGPTKKLPVGEKLEKVTVTVEKLTIDEDNN